MPHSRCATCHRATCHHHRHPPPPSTFHLPLSTATAATLAGAHLRSAHNRHDRRYFVVFTRPHSGADFLCKLLNRHPEITCAGELFNPAHGSTERLGFTVEQQRADVQVQLLRLSPQPWSWS